MELDPPTEDEESDAGTEEEDNMMTMQLWHELKDGDEGALMQTFAESNHPVYGMLVETFVVALQKHDERERANIAAHMLKLLRDGARNGTASMSEQAETLEAALVVFSEGASTTVLGSSAHSDWVKHWWNLLAPHLARGGACESRSGTVVGPESLRRRRDPNYGTDHSFGIPPEDMLAAVVEAEEEERHLRRLNTYQPGEEGGSRPASGRCSSLEVERWGFTSPWSRRRSPRCKAWLKEGVLLTLAEPWDPDLPTKGKDG